MSRILISEDETVIAMELERALEAMGHEVVGRAGTGKEAVRMAGQLISDLVMMDIVMPGEMDGIAAAQIIRAEADIPVIFLTAFAANDVVERAKQVQPSGYLVKPFLEDQVRAAVEIALFKKEMALQLQAQQQLNQTLIDSLPHPAMLIRRDRTIMVANRMAREAGAKPGDYCWRSFGKSLYIPDYRKKLVLKNAGKIKLCGTKCSFCLADESYERQETSESNSEVEAFGQLWDTYWIPINDDVYLHYAINITERKQMEETLRRSRDELEARVAQRTADLKELSAKLLDVQETERKKIALDLHDNIGQCLVALKLGVDSAIHKSKVAPKEECLSTLEALIPAVQKAIEEVRRIHVDLRPPQLDDLGIVATVSWFCRELEQLCTGIRIRPNIGLMEDQVPVELKIVIFRILQEAINNAVKHSHADTIHVSLKQSNGEIELTVVDNGCGIDMSRLNKKGRSGSFGLRSMKERAGLSGGSFSIEAEPGSGTTVRVSWPFA